MTKIEIIQKIQDACKRVLKQANYAEGVVSALTVVITRLTGVRDELAKASDMDPNLHQMLFDELYECGRIIGSIYDGFPMVPAEALSDSSDTTKLAAADVAKICAELLEKSAGTPQVGPAVAQVLCLAALWKATGEEDAEGSELVVPKLEAMPKLAREDSDRRAAAKTATEKPESDKPAEPEPAAPPDDPVAKLDTIAKAAEPAAQTPAAPSFYWPTDLNPRR